MEASKPLVSVIIPVYNTELYIRESIESVLAQSYSPIEILAVDDGSKDSSMYILQEYAQAGKIKLLQHEGGVNKGVSKTRKLGINQSKGQFICFLDADDAFLPLKVEKQVQVLLEHKEVVLCHTKVDYMAEKGLQVPYKYSFREQDFKYNLTVLKERITLNPIFNSSVMVRVEVIKAVDLEMPQLFQFEDWIAWLLCAEKGDFYYLHADLCKYRYHDTSATYKLFNNALRDKYSWVEFYLCILGKFKNTSPIVQETFQRLDVVLAELASLYNPNELAKENIAAYLHSEQQSQIAALTHKIAYLENTLKKRPLTRLVNALRRLVKR